MPNKILIVEDDETLNEMYSMKFTMEGFDVESVLEGETAIEKIKLAKPDIVLLDIMMPGMNGLEVLNIIKENIDENIKVIIFSNLNDRGNIKLALNMGADEYLLKVDTTPQSAVNIVNEMLRGEYVNREY